MRKALNYGLVALLVVGGLAWALLVGKSRDGW